MVLPIGLDLVFGVTLSCQLRLCFVLCFHFLLLLLLLLLVLLFSDFSSWLLLCFHFSPLGSLVSNYKFDLVLFR